MAMQTEAVDLPSRSGFRRAGGLPVPADPHPRRHRLRRDLRQRCWRPTTPRSAASPRASVRRPGRPAAAPSTSSAPTISGRDVLSRLIFGARVSMVVGFTAVIFAGVVGTVLGIVSGYLGGWVDQVIMRITDTWLALPALTFAIFLAAIVGPSEMNIVIILGARLLDALCARHPRRGALAQGAGVRAPGHRGRMLQAHHHARATSCPTSSTRPSCSAR